ncbi:hypothetical protein DRN34_05370 [Thermococci archaeon]|nr:MAG: hypothetical protein DRN34_05370 [Thermococci archaeon]
MMPARDLQVHQEGVSQVRCIYPTLVAANDQAKHSHFDPMTGRFIRQKTDTYPFKNIFIEEFSSVEEKTAGGPFQAMLDGCALLCHYYPEEHKVVWTHLNTQSINIIFSMLRRNEVCMKMVSNGDYTTKGYAIPIAHYTQQLGNLCEVHSL